MTSPKNTKRAFAAGAVLLLLCVAMLIGTTFAWFTDTASTSVNKIQAGTLDVALEMKNPDYNPKEEGSKEWISAEGKTLDFVKTEGHEDENILWEPGCTYTLPELRIANNGNLALKYKVLISGIKGDAKLNDAIEWTVDGLDIDAEVTLVPEATKEFTISGHMKETVGNEYQDLSIDGISITVVATQQTAEFDSYNNTYDEMATYLNTDADGNILIGSAGDLRYFAATVNADNSAYVGKIVKLTSDIDLGGIQWTPINWTDRNGFTFDGNGKTISNFKVTAASGEKYKALFGNADMATIKDLTISNAQVTGIGYVGALVGHGMCTKIYNCKVIDSTVTGYVYKNDDGDKVGAIAGWLGEGGIEVKDCTVTGCTVKGYRDIGGLVGFASGATVSGNTVSDTQVIVDNSANCKGYKKSTDYNAKAVVGRVGDSGVTESGSTTSNVTVKLPPAVPESSQDMISALQTSGGGVKVEQPLTLDGTVDSATGQVNTYKEVQLSEVGTVDLVLNNTVTSGNISSYTWGLMRVMPGTTLEISADENGKFINASGNAAIINVCGGKTVVNSGYFESATACFWVYTDVDSEISNISLTINGGTFKTGADGVIDNSALSLDRSQILINGGKFYNWDPSAYVDANHKVTASTESSDTVYTVSAK